jgi:vitamin B12 transporter
LLVLAETLKQHVTRPGAPFAPSSRRIDGAALGVNGYAGSHHWQAAVRRDRNSQFGNQTTGSAAYAFDATPRWRVGLSAGTSFNAPSFNQLYYPGFGNPALQPEKGEHGELWLRWAMAAHEWRATWFASRIRGYITPGQNPTNVDARVDGVSISGSTHWAGWKLGASGEWLDPRNANPLHAQFGRQLPRRTREVLRATGERRLGAWTFGASLLHNGSRFEDLANATRLGGYTVVDLRLDRAIGKHWQLGIALNNAGDRRYETVFGYHQPGRQLFATLRTSVR